MIICKGWRHGINQLSGGTLCDIFTRCVCMAWLYYRKGYWIKTRQHRNRAHSSCYTWLHDITARLNCMTCLYDNMTWHDYTYKMTVWYDYMTWLYDMTVWQDLLLVTAPAPTCAAPDRTKSPLPASSRSGAGAGAAPRPQSGDKIYLLLVACFRQSSSYVTWDRCQEISARKIAPLLSVLR